MPDANQIAHGLLVGFGKGAGNVGKSMLDREKAAAAELRAQNLARFQHGLSMDAQKDQQGFVTGEREAKEEYESGLLGSTVDTAVDDEGNPVVVKLDKSGKPIGEAIPRAPKKGEAGYIDPEGTSGSVKAADLKIGMDRVFKQSFSKYANSLKAEGKELDMSQFMIVNADGTSGGINEAVIEAQLPQEMQEEFKFKLRAMEQRMKQGQSPITASQEAEVLWNKVVETGRKTAEEKQGKEKQQALDDIAEQSGIPVSKLKAAQDAPATEEMADKVLAGYNPSDPKSKAELLALSKLNPELYALVNTKLSNQQTQDVPSPAELQKAHEQFAPKQWWEDEGLLGNP